MQLTARALKLLELIVVLTLFVAIQCVNGSTSFLEQCLGAIAIGSATLDSPAIIQCTRAQLLAPLIYNTSDGSITRITNCVFFGCGNIVASTPLVLSNVVFHKSTYAGKYSPTNTGGAMSLINTTATMYNVTFEGCGFVG